MNVVCSICHTQFSRKDSLKRHMNRKHQFPSFPAVSIARSETSCPPFYMEHPFTCMVAGATGCGKTVWVKKLLEHAQMMISPPPQRIVYCYSQWQPAYVEMLRTVPGINFIRGIPQELENDHFLDVNVRNLIVIDDQMTETGNDKRIVNLFAKGSHHRNLSVIYMVQNIFHQGKINRDISLNCHYLVIFKNPRDKLQILNLAKQMYPGKTEYFLEKYEQAVSRPYGYLFIDLKTTTPDNCRLRTAIFPGEENDQRGEDKVSEELLQYLERQNLALPPEFSRMQNLQGQMNNLLKDPFIDKSQKTRQYIQLQNNYLRYKHKMNPSHVELAIPTTSRDSSAALLQPRPGSTLESSVPARISPALPAEPPLPSSSDMSSPSLPSTETLASQTPMSTIMASSPSTLLPSSLLTPPDSLPKRRKRPRLELKNYLEGDVHKKATPPRIRRSVRMKSRFPYKYENL